MIGPSCRWNLTNDVFFWNVSNAIPDIPSPDTGTCIYQWNEARVISRIYVYMCMLYKSHKYIKNMYTSLICILHFHTSTPAKWLLPAIYCTFHDHVMILLQSQTYCVANGQEACKKDNITSRIWKIWNKCLEWDTSCCNVIFERLSWVRTLASSQLHVLNASALLTSGHICNFTYVLM